MTAFIGIYKAVYDYQPQTAEELAISEGDLLYLLEKSDVDEWWTVKKRVIGSDADEPIGLVPSNYVEVAPSIGEVKAIYDYEQTQNPDEELIFHENEQFDVFDDQDSDWLLVQSKTSKQFGFIPGNYVEAADAATAPAPAPAQVAAIAPPVLTPADAATMLPPPQHPSKSTGSSPMEDTVIAEPDAPPAMPTRNARQEVAEEAEDVPPPKPSRPTQQATEEPVGVRETSRNRISYHSSYNEGNHDSNNSNSGANEHSNGRSLADTNDYDYDYEDSKSDYRTWSISEIDGRKKRKCKLSIGNNKIYFQPQKGEPQEWSVDKLTSYDKEKKHMFLEFIDPYKSLELHTGNNDTCAEILSVIAEYKGASRDAGLREVELASKPKKQGNILYDFMAESQDELTVKQGQAVYILNDRKSRDWWMCEIVGSGKRGVVPAQFVEPIKDKNDSSHGILSSFKKFAKGNGKGSNSKLSGKNWKDDDDQDLSSDRRNRNKSRSNSTSKRKRSASTSNNNNGNDKSPLPDPKKSRIWADRSGTFKVEAQFIGCSDGKIHLHKSNGVKIAVAADKLSDDDIIYVERATGFSLDKYKIKKQDTKDARESERERRKKLREHDEKERDRRLREREIEELKQARLLLDEERAKLQERELPPVKPPRPQSTGSATAVYPVATGTPSASAPAGAGAAAATSKTQQQKKDYDWFEFFLNCGVDVSNCQRYSLNFEREQVTEDMLSDINSSMLRTLGLKEGDIVRVMKYLDNKFGRDSQLPQQPTNAPGGMFSEPDGSLKVAATGAAPAFATQLLPQKTAPVNSTGALDDEAWTVKPAAKSEINLPSNQSEFTGSMQDLLDLQPLEPKKNSIDYAPQPKLNELEPVKSSNTGNASNTTTVTSNTGTVMAPLDPFKTGGHNLLPMATGFVMMPIATGGFMPVQRTGGLMLPQATGNVLQPQRTSGRSLSMTLTGGFMPQTSFQTQPSFQIQPTSNIIPLQKTGGALNAPPLGSILPLQKTVTGLMPANATGSILPMQITGGIIPIQATGGLVPLQRTGGTLPMQATGGLIPLQRTGGMGQINITGGSFAPQVPFNNQLTGGMNMMPQTSFGNQITGGANLMPQTSFGANIPGRSNMIPQTSFGANLNNVMPQTSFSNNLTGGVNIMPQTSFSNNVMGGSTALPQNSFGSSNMGFTSQMPFNNTQGTGGVMQTGNVGNYSLTQPFPNMTGVPQQNTQFGLQATGGMVQNQAVGQPTQQFQNNINSGMNGITQGIQNTSISQPPALQTQPTGFGFGNGPQLQQQQQPRQANLYNATADNPFGF